MSIRRSPVFSKITPAAAGCYIVRAMGRVLYVGQSKNIQKRWKTHHCRRFIETNFPDATIETILCNKGDLLQKEAELIRELQPLMNGADGESKVCDELGIDPKWWWYEKSPREKKLMLKAMTPSQRREYS